jgi:microcystin-dependent protein
MTPNTVGATAGEFKHQLSVEELVAHTHLNGVADDAGKMFVYDKVTTDIPGSATESIQSESNARAYQGETSEVGESTSHNNMQPYRIVAFIKKLY